MAKAARQVETITLNQLISESSNSVLRAIQEIDTKRKFNPRIWVGIWIDPYGPGEIDIGGVGPRG